MPTQTGTQTTIKVIPTGATPTYNETVVVLESPNIQSDNFKWLVDIYKGVSTDTVYEVIASIVILPNPDGFGVIDFHRIIENHISTSFYPADVDHVSEKAFNEGLKWSFQVTEQFENPVWRFDDNRTNLGPDVAFRTDNAFDPTSTFDQHPFITGDVVSIVQDPGFDHAAYNTAGTTLTYYDEWNVITDIPKLADTPINPGVMTLVGGGTRTIEQVFGVDETVIYSFNGALSFQDFRNWDASDYDMGVASPDTTKFLLDGPREFDITLNDRVWINHLMTDTAPGLVEIETDNGVYLIQQLFVPTQQHFINQNKVGPVDLLETIDTIIPFSGSLPVIDANTTFIEFTMNTNVGVAGSETIRMNIVDPCSKYEPIRFFYLDKLGSYVPITFNKVNRTNINNTRSNYRQNYGTYDSVSNAWGYTTYDRGTTTYDLVSTEKVTCTSDWLTEDQVSMVVNMLNSPIVYIQDQNGDYVAITITTNSYEEKKRVNDKLMNYTLSFEYAQTNTNQRG